jgi:hypothetical protein
MLRMKSRQGCRRRYDTVRLGALALAALAAHATAVHAGGLAVVSRNATPGSGGAIVVTGQLSGESTFGVTVLVELVPRTGNVGTATFTTAPPTDIAQVGDPWPGFGTFSAFDSDLTGSPSLNGAIDDNGTFVAQVTSFSGPLVEFPFITSADAEGVWDIVLATSQGVSGWEALTTTLSAGTLTLVSGGCINNGQCDDGVFCNGAETCSSGSCFSGSNPCPGQLCDEAADACIGCTVDAECDDGLFCSGAEACVNTVCVGGSDPCPGELCDEIGDACAADAAQLTAGELILAPDTIGNVVISGAIDGDPTFGVTVFAEIRSRAGNAGAVTFTSAPPTDIQQVSDPWPGAGTFTVFDTDQTGSNVLNGYLDDNGTFVPSPLTFSGALVTLPVHASADAGGVWDVILSGPAGTSAWEGVPTALGMGTISVVPKVSLSVTGFSLPPGATAGLMVNGNIEGESTYGVTTLVTLVPRAGNSGTLAFTTAPPIDITAVNDPWPGVGAFTPFDTNLSGSSTLNGSVDDNGSFVSGPVVFSGPLARFPLVASSDADGVWDVLLRTAAGDSRWENLNTVLVNGAVVVTADACLVDSNCDDGNPCTADVCALGVCGSTAIVGGCDDGNLCSINDTCTGTVCSGEPVDCTGLNDACNVGTCNVGTGACEPTPANEGGVCDDLDPCTETDLCVSGTCTGTSIPGCINCGIPADCDDANVCTDEDCIGGVCSFTANALDCDDGDACTTADSCSGGVCVGGAPPVCEDSNGCTDDSCDSLSGCQFIDNTAVCDDGDPCTGGDVCAAGVCTATPIPGCVNCSTNAQCNDNNVCTSESCVGGACAYVNVSASCNDGNFCTTADSCSAGVCAGTPKNCTSLNNACNVGVCNAANGVCEAQPANEGGGCNDGLSCTINDACVMGQCRGTLTSPAGVNLALVPGAPSVQVGSALLVQLVANSTTCATMPVGSTEVILRWDPTKLQFVRRIRPTPAAWDISWFPNDSALDGLNAPYTGVPANDGHAFWQGIGDFQDGAAVTSTGRTLVTFEFLAIDGSSGTTISMDQVFGSFTETRILGAEEYIGQDLTGALSGTTVPVNECGVNADCNDGNVCTNDSCVGGVCQHTNNSNSCNDGFFCTSGDVCSGGTCMGGANPCSAPLLCSESLDACVQCLSAANCNDGNVCTTDSCNGQGSCVNSNNTIACNDGLFCTQTDQCSGGACVGSGNRCPGLICDEPNDRCVQCLSPADCNDGNLCTNDVCSGNVCSNPNNSNSCNDFLFCTSNDTCSGGACVGGANPCASPSFCSESFDACVQCLQDSHCNDGNPCTTDSCQFGSCQNQNNSVACNDGAFCTASDVCSGGVCVGSGNACPGLLCNEAADSCVECFTVGDCDDDGIACTVDQCTAGVCQYVPNHSVCGDGVFCNGVEQCNVTSGCVSAGNPCDDPNLCNETNDSCGCRPVNAIGEGSRYIAVTPQDGVNPVALRVTGLTPEVACVTQYVQADGRLGVTPVFRAPTGTSGWNTVHVRGTNIRPNADYEIRTECQTGLGVGLSSPVTATTWLWADTDNSRGLVEVTDIVLIVDGFRGDFSSATLYALDLWGADASACLPQRILDLMDITRALDAFRQLPFPCTQPCP